jgi:Flp pilus assembly protein CpaB
MANDRIRILLTIAVGAAAVAGIVLTTRASAPATPRDPTEPVGVTNTQDPTVIESYWTDERRRNATGG